jgi:hypothetical protein
LSNRGSSCHEAWLLLEYIGLALESIVVTWIKSITIYFVSCPDSFSYVIPVGSR